MITSYDMLLVILNMWYNLLDFSFNILCELSEVNLSQLKFFRCKSRILLFYCLLDFSFWTLTINCESFDIILNFCYFDLSEGFYFELDIRPIDDNTCSFGSGVRGAQNFVFFFIG